MRSILTKIWVFARPFLAVILGLIAISKFNLFDVITIVPEDYKYEVCLTLYVGLSEAIIRCIEDFLSNNSSSIQCIFSFDKRNFDITNTPMIVLPDDNISIANVYCQIKVHGKVGFIKNSKIVLCFPDWVDVDVCRGTGVVEIHGNRSCVINLSNFVNQDQRTVIETTQIIQFSLLKATIDREGQYIVDSKLEKKRISLNYIFKSNKFEIRR